jgi:hypothetical protein
LDVSVHLLDTSLDVTREIDVRLLTPPEFHGCDYSGANTFKAIATPDGKIMHKPSKPLTISRGDADSVEFDFYPVPFEIFKDRTVMMTLRLLSAGLRRDLTLSVVLED